MSVTQDIITTFFSGIWSLFTNTDVPGFGISLAKVFTGFLIVRVCFAILSSITGFNASNDASYGGASDASERKKRKS